MYMVNIHIATVPLLHHYAFGIWYVTISEPPHPFNNKKIYATYVWQKNTTFFRD